MSESKSWPTNGLAREAYPSERYNDEKGTIEGSGPIKTQEQQELDYAIHLLGNANSEIKQLRDQNRRMTERLNVYENMMELFHANGSRNGAMCCGADVNYEIDQFVRRKQEEKRNESDPIT